MRKLLLASVAVVGASAGLLGTAFAQAPATLPPDPMSGSFVVAPNGGTSANNNNNYAGYYTPGANANPTPGSMVIRLSFANWFYLSYEGSAADVVGPSKTGVVGGTTFKINPYNALEYFRIYPGVDAMATNGLRYGSVTEIRENWSAQSYNAASPGAAAGSAYDSSGNASSGFTCTQTLYVRRAFVYLGAASVGIFRFGQGDSPIGTFDNGVTTFQNFDTGNWNGDTPSAVPGNLQPTWPYLSQQGADYGSTKVVYFSPQFAGFDFGASWAPNNTNGEGPCGLASTACPQLTSSAGTSATASAPGTSGDPRWNNEFMVAARYQGTLGPVGVYGYAAYVGSGHTSYTGPATSAFWNGKYNNISAGNVGLVLTIAGVSVGGNYFGGSYNGANLTQPNGGAPGNAWTAGVQYTNGPWTAGIAYTNYQEQGAVSLTHISQRYEDMFDIGGTWNAAPGLWFYAQYLWEQLHQGDFNYVLGSNGPLENTVNAQAFTIGTKVRW